MPDDLDALQPARMFDGGDLDCGSGLALLIRDNMQHVGVGEVLEIRSREATVRNELPAWCRIVGHEHLGHLEGEDGSTRYFVRKGEKVADVERNFDEDKAKAKEYEWRLRARVTGHLRATAYCRNFSFDLGQPASFGEKDEHPSALEHLMASLAGSLAVGFATECARDALKVDDIEISVRASLHNVLAHLGIEEGDPSIRSIHLKCFASSFDDASRLRAAWELAVARSPIAATLRKGVDIEFKFGVV